jgi:hypothetical protein
MTIHLFLDIIISLGIVLALTKKYSKPGLLLLGLGFLAKAVFAFGVDNDIAQGVIDIAIILSVLYDYSKMVRHNYAPTKRGRLMAGVVFILLGVWMTTLGTFSPFLIAGVMGVLVILIEDSVSPKMPSQKI